MSGLLAYFLSIPIGDHQRELENIAASVRHYVVLHLFFLYKTVIAISNGLDGDSERTERHRWFGIPGDYKSVS